MIHSLPQHADFTSEHEVATDDINIVLLGTPAGVVLELLLNHLVLLFNLC